MNSTRHILDDIDYLTPLINYLGSNPYWWARSAPSLAKELGLDANRVQALFDRYPMIFRKSRLIEEANAHAYALQHRFSRRTDGREDEPSQVSDLPVLSEQQLVAVMEFLVKVSTLETTVRSAKRTVVVAAMSAVISATAAIAVAFWKTIGASAT